MALTFKSVSASGWASTSGPTITAPSGMAAGDLLILHYGVVGVTGRDWNTGDGWTHELDNQSLVANQSRSGFQYKFATSDDVTAGSFSFSINGGAAFCNGAIYCFSDAASSGTIVDNYDSSAASSGAVTFTNTVTPTDANNGLLFLIFSDNNGNGDTTGYAITTSNPTWTERYDVSGLSTNYYGIHGATAIRPETTATGDSSATVGVSSPNCGGIMISIKTKTDVTVSPSVITATATVQAPTITGGATVSPAVITATATVQAPTITTANAKWTNIDKTDTSPDITNIDKS